MRNFICSTLIVVFAAAVCVAQVPTSNHVYFLVEENEPYTSVIGNSSLPYINGLAQKYGLATSYYGNTHPSIGNYFMMTTGQIYTNDDSYLGPLPSSVDNIVRRLMTAGKTWKSYAEGVPYAGYLGGNTLSNGDYYKRHDPFSYFSDVANSSTEKMNLVDTNQLVTDLANNQSPNLSFIVPNGMDDAHDGTPQAMDNWLSQYVPKILASKGFQEDGILFITFDESVDTDTTHGGGHIMTIVISPKGKAGYKSTTLYQHQSLLKSMLLALSLPTDLLAASTAPDMGEFFGASTAPAPTPTPTPTPTPKPTPTPIPTPTPKPTPTSAPTTGAGVTITAPANGATSGSPVTVVASATASSGKTIMTMRCYVDGVSAYTVSANHINYSLAMTAGTHHLIINAWDNTGAVYVSGSTTITVGSASAPAPTPTPTPAPITGAGVTITAPVTGATSGSPVTVVASAAAPAGRTISTMRCYVDGISAYTVSANHIKYSLAMSAGTHHLIINAWDNTGAVYVSGSTTITVGGASSGAPVPTPTPTPTPAPVAPSGSFDTYPSTALVTSHMEDDTWNSCNCGGTGSNPSSETLSKANSEATFKITGNGGGVSGWLWYSAFGSADANNWIMDYDVTPSTNLATAAALEFDGNQTGSRGNFVFGTECNFGYNPSRKTVWRFWTTSGGETWGTTTYACPITQANHTYHVQMHFIASSGTYEVAHVKVTDTTTGTVVQNDQNLGVFNSVGSDSGHGNSLDVQEDVPGSASLAASYQNITLVRW